MSNKKKYESQLGAKGLITAPHYLAEQITIKRAAQKKFDCQIRYGTKDYFPKVYNGKYWCGAYWGEHLKACEILKEFDADCVIKALQSKECEVILSLHNEKLRRVASELQRQKELAEQFKEVNTDKVAPTNTLPRSKYGKKSKLGRLS